MRYLLEIAEKRNYISQSDQIIPRIYKLPSKFGENHILINFRTRVLRRICTREDKEHRNKSIRDTFISMQGGSKRDMHVLSKCGSRHMYT
jgi:hypothetical protein